MDIDIVRRAVMGDHKNLSPVWRKTIICFNQLNRFFFFLEKTMCSVLFWDESGIGGNQRNGKDRDLVLKDEIQLRRWGTFRAQLRNNVQ